MYKFDYHTYIFKYDPKPTTMADIFHNFPIEAPTDKVFEAISHSDGLDKWWTKHSAVNINPGGMYTLDFGPGYIWKAVVSEYVKEKVFELKMTEAVADKISSYCWAMYLRILKRYVEFGEEVPYEKRLQV
jgi:Activator of Hsp90 ATPase homolog 1-like protein